MSVDNNKSTSRHQNDVVAVERLIDFASNDNTGDYDDRNNDNNSVEELEGDMPRVEEIDLISSKQGNDRELLLHADDDDDFQQPPTVGFRNGRHVHNGSIGSASDLGGGVHGGKNGFV